MHIFYAMVPTFSLKKGRIDIRGHPNIKMSSYQYNDPHVNDKTVLWLSYL